MPFLTNILFPLRLLIAIPLAPLITICYYILIILFGIPSALIRQCVSFICHKIDKDLCKLVTPRGSVTSRDFSKWQTAPSQCINILIVLKGPITLDNFRNLASQQIVNKSVNGVLEFPELQQYCTKRLGYLFFKWDRHFDIKNHVNYFQSKKSQSEELIDEEKLHGIFEDVGKRPFAHKKSPWEMLFIPNYQPDKEKNSDEYTAVIFRIQHCVGDGAAIMRALLMMCINGSNIWEMQYRSKMPPKHFAFWRHLNALIFGPSAFVWKILKGIDFRNPLHKSRNKITGKSFVVFKSIDLKKVKAVREIHHDVSFHSVLIAGLAGGIRKYFLNYGKSIPFSPIRMAIPIIMPGHSRKLRNEYMSNAIELPVHKKTARKRLFACEKRLVETKNTAVMPFLTQVVLWLGTLPVNLIRRLTRDAPYTTIYSVAKGPDTTLIVKDGNCHLHDFMYNASLGPDNLGLLFCSFSYRGKINITLTVDQGLVKTREKAKQLLHYIEREIEELQYGDSTNL